MIIITMMILMIIMSEKMIIVIKITLFQLRCNANASFGQGQFIKM